MPDLTDDNSGPQEPQPPHEPPENRRKFFARALGEMLSPFSSIIEAKINPIIKAFEALPDEVDRQTAALGAAVGARKSLSLPVARSPERILRPPGALPEADFQSLCSRCNICVQVCPAQCIKIDAGKQIGGGFPCILPAEAACVVCDDLSCMNSCPTGALVPVDKFHINMGLARVDPETCLRHHGEDCRLCVEACPLGSVAIAISTHSGNIRVKRNGCVGCGMCEQSCPTEPRSIIVMPATPPVEPMVV